MNKDIESIYAGVCANGPADINEKCSRDPAYIFGRDQDGNTLLHYAARDGNLDAVKQLMKLGACPFISNSEGMTPLSDAAWHDDASILEFLLEKSSPGLLDDDLAELMAIAASQGKYKNLEFMLNHGLDCNARYRGDPILYWAMQSARLDITKLLCEHGADINAVNHEGMTPLFDASATGLTDICAYLASRGACIDKPADDGSTPLIIASCYDRMDVVKILLAHRCDIKAKTRAGVTALLFAIGYGNVEIVKLLLGNGADKNVMDKKNKGINAYCNRIKSKRLQNDMRNVLRIPD